MSTGKDFYWHGTLEPPKFSKTNKILQHNVILLAVLLARDRY